MNLLVHSFFGALVNPSASQDYPLHGIPAQYSHLMATDANPQITLYMMKGRRKLEDNHVDNTQNLLQTLSLGSDLGP